MKKLLSIIMLLSLTGSLYTMEGNWKEEEQEQSGNSIIMTKVTWDFLKELPGDIVLSIISYLPLKERLHVLAGLLFEIKKRSHLLSDREEFMKSLLKADDKESWKMGRDVISYLHRGPEFVKQNTNKIIKLIQNGANVNLKDDYGFTPLHYTINIHGVELEYSLNIINVLLNVETDVNISHADGVTPLLAVAIKFATNSKPNLKLIQALIKRGANPTKVFFTGCLWIKKTPRQILEHFKNKCPLWILKNEEEQAEVEKMISHLKAAEEAWEQKTANKEQ